MAGCPIQAPPMCPAELGRGGFVTKFAEDGCPIIHCGTKDNRIESANTLRDLPSDVHGVASFCSANGENLGLGAEQGHPCVVLLAKDRAEERVLKYHFPNGTKFNDVFIATDRVPEPVGLPSFLQPQEPAAGLPEAR